MTNSSVLSPIDCHLHSLEQRDFSATRFAISRTPLSQTSFILRSHFFAGCTSFCTPRRMSSTNLLINQKYVDRAYIPTLLCILSLQPLRSLSGAIKLIVTIPVTVLCTPGQPLTSNPSTSGNFICFYSSIFLL